MPGEVSPSQPVSPGAIRQPTRQPQPNASDNVWRGGTQPPAAQPQPGAPRSQPAPRTVGGRPVYDRGDARTLPRPVGGPVRGVGDADAPRSRSSLRKTFDRPTPRQGDAAVDGRRVTTRTIADRYQPRPTAHPRDVSPVAPRTTPTAQPRTPVRPVADRYAPTPRPRASTPSLQPRTGVVNGAIGRRIAPPAAVPRLNPRSSVAAPGSRHRGVFGGLHGSCSVPAWGWRHRHSGLWLSSSWCWSLGWSSPWWWNSCSPTSWYWSSSCYDGWAWNWCRPRHHVSVCWWWPTSCYYPTYYYGYDAGYVPSYVYQPTYVVAADPAPAAPAKAEMTPRQLAEKYVGLGDFYFAEGRFAEAADAYARAHGYAPEDPSILFAQSDAAFATGDYHFAAYLIGEALRLEPGMARAETDKRLLYKDVKLFEQQMDTLRKYLAEKPYDAMAGLVLAYNLKFSGQADAAAAAFRRVLEIDPESSAAKVFLDALTPAAPAEKAAEKKDAAPGTGG